MSVQTFEQARAAEDRRREMAYNDGYKAGVVDLALGFRSEYSYHAADDPGYPGWYGQGYRDGVDGREADNPWEPLAARIERRRR